jgi:hypothetical protein
MVSTPPSVSARVSSVSSRWPCRRCSRPCSARREPASSYNIGRIFAAVGTVFFGIFAKPSDFSSVLLYASFLFLPAAILALWLPTEEATS